MSILTCIITCLSILYISGNSSFAVNPYIKWENGPSHETDFFPIAVWSQSSSNALKYKQIGINTYVGLWKGPTEKQLSELKKADMKVICHQNDIGLDHIDDRIIVGWMHSDEPDNARWLGQDKGYGPPINPQKIIDKYIRIQNNDLTRPVFLNLSQGVAWDGWYGRGVRTNHPEDYLEYIKGCDIVSFDIYPVVESNPEIAGKLWYVAEGVNRLVEWSKGQKVIWNCIECTHINNAKRKATTEQVRAEVWMSIIHGSMGIIYFVHEWQPRFNESALLSDTEMLSAVTDINQQIAKLAPVLNTPTLKSASSILLENKKVPIAFMIKEYEKQMYLFAVGMSHNNTSASFTIDGLKGERLVKVLFENRTIISKDGVFEDSFNAWDVHLYQIR